MTEKTTKSNRCVCCNRQFLVLDIGDEHTSLYCSEDCQEKHSIFLLEESTNSEVLNSSGGRS